MDESEGDYDAYDLSEFSAADFAHIDSAPGCGLGRVDSETSGSGGPQIAVALERAADESVVVKVAVGGVGTGGGREDSDDAVGPAEVRNADGSDGGKGKSGRHPFKAANRRSPYEMHRSRGALMSVSDLVGPAWYVLVFFGGRAVLNERSCSAPHKRCEVQFDYGLRQGRSLALADRPDSFVSAKGKVIAVEKKVAEVNENVLEHGRVRILFFTILCVPLLTDFPPLTGNSSLFTRYWKANYTQNRLPSHLIRMKSTGQYGITFHLTAFLRLADQLPFSVLLTC